METAAPVVGATAAAKLITKILDFDVTRAA